MTTQNVTAILVRLLPDPPTDAGTFTSYLENLTITAYDQTVLPVDPTQPSPGVAEFKLGVASSVSTPVWQPPLLPPFVVGVTPGSATNPLPLLSSTIFQHYTWFLDPLNPLNPPTLQSVATAVIIVDIPGLNTNPAPPSPYPAYPSTTSYDVRLSMQRGATPVVLPDPPIQYSVRTTTLTFQISPFNPVFVVDDLGISEATPTNSSMYVLLPKPPPSDAPIASTIHLQTDGTAPTFEELVNAVNPVLLAYNLAGASSLAGLTVPLTKDQCDNIANKIVFNPQLEQLPVPVPAYPTPIDPSAATLNQLYTGPSSAGDNGRKQFEGSLSAFHATSSAATKLSPYIFAAAAAVYAEIQTTLAMKAAWTFPIFKADGTSTSSATVTITNSNQSPLGSNFVVPAAYFYALCSDYPATSDADHRYKTILTTTTDTLSKQLQTALTKGILTNTETPITISGAASVTNVGALMRLASLSANFAPGSDPVVYFEGSVQTLVTDWLAGPPTVLGTQSPFWTTVAPGTTPIYAGPDYLNLILQVVAKSPSITSNFINDIRVAKLLPPLSSPTAITKASDLASVTNAAWLALFTSLNTPPPNDLPSWLGAGTVANKTQTFINWIQILFTVGFQPAAAPTPSNGNVSTLGTDFASDVLAKFFSLYSGFSFDNPLDPTEISTIITNNFPDPVLQAWITNALSTIRALYVMTKFTTSPVDPTLQFSYMEALYARGFTTAESVAILTTDQFKSALTGTVAYGASDTIYQTATTLPVTTPVPQPDPGNGFQPCNPGSLVNCIPPPNLSPFERVEYVYELLQLSSGTLQLSDAVSARRGPLNTLQASIANLELKIDVIDLVNESLEGLGSNLSVVQGSVYNTTESSLAGFNLGDKPGDLPPDKALAAIPEFSSPSVPVSQPPIYDTLKTTLTSPSLPYSQPLDICRSYLCHLGTTRFDTMRHFRRDITEFPLDLTNEPVDFEQEQWRLPVQLDVALEYLQISKDEYTALWTSSLTNELIAQLYGIDITETRVWQYDVLVVPNFLAATGLTYCEFVSLWKTGFVSFSRQSAESTESSSENVTSADFPDCPPCCMSSLVISFSSDDVGGPLTELIIFIRLWRKLQLRCENKISMECLADICSVLKLFDTGNGISINPSFIRQLASLIMLVDLFRLPWSEGQINATTTGVERTKLLGIWTGPNVDPGVWHWAVKTLLSGIERHALYAYGCRKRGAEFAEILSKNLDEISALAGFTTSNTWFSSPTCTIRFAEVLAKIYASNFTVGELIFLFTTKDHLDGDDPFPMESFVESIDNPLSLPDDQPQRLAILREKLLKVEICAEEVEKWDWHRVNAAIRDVGFGGSSDPLVYLSQHFFPDLSRKHGYYVNAEKRRFTTSLPRSSTSPSMWGLPPCGPFHYSYDPSNEESGELWIQLPLSDGEVIHQLRFLRQLNFAEIRAVQDLYFGPRVALAPFAMIFSNFGHDINRLIMEPSEYVRFEIFKGEVALFYRRCEVIADYLTDHVASVFCFDNEQTHEPERETTWKILKSLIADENRAMTSWEDDSGQAPINFTYDVHFSGNAFAAILGLIGTGLEGGYRVGSKLTWEEMRGGINAFGLAENEWNIPVPTVIPSLNVVPTQAEDEFVTFKNGFLLLDKNGEIFGGAQSFETTWTGSLIIDEAGQYRFGAGIPCSDDEMPKIPDIECCSNESWLITLGRGQKTWIVLNQNSKGFQAPAHTSHPVHLHNGVYNLTIKFIQPQLGVCKCGCKHRKETGFQLKYKGPDTNERPCEVPFCRLLRDFKNSPFKVVSDKDTKQDIPLSNSASEFLQLQYVSTFRDIRRTYQRAFKATLFAQRFNLSAKMTHCDHQSELGYILEHGTQFRGTSYFAGTPFLSHHADFDFNFLPVADSYHSPDASVDSRVDPSPKRQAALFDWFERIFDYACLRENVEKIRKRPIWLLFHDVDTQDPTSLDQYVRYLGIDIKLAQLALEYQAVPSPYQVVPIDLLDERWVIRMWRVREWICLVSENFYSELLEMAVPYLWASDDPNLPIGGPNGNQNLTYFVQHGSLSNKPSPRLFKAITKLNDGLRLRARQALIAFLCGMDRVAVSLPGVGPFVTKPSELSDLLLQDVEAGIHEKSSRIDNAILSIQTFIQRAKMSLEPSFPLTLEFSKAWDNRFSSFDKWVAWKRREVYSENWVQWEELQRLQRFEGSKFLTEELKQLTSTIAEPGKPMWWAGENFPPHSILEPIQVEEVITFETQGESEFDGFSLIAMPQRDARPSLLAASLAFPQPPTSGGGASSSISSTEVTKVKGLTTAVSDATGIGTLEVIPLWVQAAVRLGTKFIRVAAAGVPPAFRYKSAKSEDAPCCAECGLMHDAVIDEYYFWLEDSKYFDYTDAPQKADVGATSGTDSYTDWENADDPSKLPTMIYWAPKPLVHLCWTRVHMGRLDPPRRSNEGIPYPTPVSATDASPLLKFTGRAIDSLNFTALSAVPVTPSGTSTVIPGFRYDIATDTVVVTPRLVGDALPPPGQPLPLASFPKFTYFEPGKPLVPVSSFGIALAMASSQRSNCRFETALKWCQLMFDPLSRVNTWAQCKQNKDSSESEMIYSDHKTKLSDKVFLHESSNSTKPTLSSSDVKVFGNSNPPNEKAPTLEPSATSDAKHIFTPATTPGETDSTKQLQAVESPLRGRDVPCCPTAPVSEPVSRARAVLLEFLKTLLQWGDRCLNQKSMESSHQALIIFNTMHRLLGPRPKSIKAKGSKTTMTLANFVASPPPLNPELLKLYDVVADRRTLIHDDEGSCRLHDGLNRIRPSTNPDPKGLSEREISNCFSRCQPYRYTSLFPKALDLINMVKGLGNELLSAYEKGDGEYLAAIRAAQDRKILDLGLKTSQNQWRASEWDVQALDQAMQGALTRLQYYQGLIQNGLNSGESGYQFAIENSMQSQNASNSAEGTAQAANIIPDLALGVAGLGPYQSTTIPIGTKLANAASAAARMLQLVAAVSSNNASLQLTQAGWARRAQEWQNQVNVITAEIQQIKRQTLSAWRHRDSALHDLNSHEQQMEHAAEVQDFMRDKFTKHELYLFLQQETATIYRQAYSLAVQTARDTQEAFRFERGDIEQDFLTNLEWNSLHEGLMAGERLEMSLRAIDRAFMDTNCREYELSKRISAKLHCPKSFLSLKTCGFAELEIPEWMFDLDYPGHYMRRLKSVTLTIACVAGPYTSINCRLQLLSSSIRIKPLIAAQEECCCDSPKDICSHAFDPYIATSYGATEAISTSTGQDDSGLFQLDFKDERYLPFEYKGAISRWRIELPPENNAWDIASLTDVMLHLNYTAREGGQALRQKANECAQRHLPGDGIRYFDVRHEFPDVWRSFGFEKDKCEKREREWEWEWRLRFSRQMFPFIVGRRAIKITRLHLFLETEDSYPSQHITVELLQKGDKECQEQKFVCVCVSGVECPCVFSGSLQVDLGPIIGSQRLEVGKLRFKNLEDIGMVSEVFLLVEYISEWQN